MAGKEKDIGVFKATPNNYYWNDYIIVKYGEIKPQIDDNDMQKKIKIIKDITKHSLDANFVENENYSIIITDDKAFDILK